MYVIKLGVDEGKGNLGKKVLPQEEGKGCAQNNGKEILGRQLCGRQSRLKGSGEIPQEGRDDGAHGKIWVIVERRGLIVTKSKPRKNSNLKNTVINIRKI